nr:hypothetical protein [Tanacetum cinerariifolium]
RKLLVKFLEDHCKTQNEMVGNDENSAFDFVYLPININRVHIQAELSPQPTQDIIIDVVDADDDITDDEDAIRHDLAELIMKTSLMLMMKMSAADVARSHGGDGGGEDCPLHTMYPAVAWVALLTEAKANESLIWAAWQRAG